MTNHNRQYILVFTISIFILLIVAQTIYACSPAVNLRIYCDEQQFDYHIYDEEDLRETLNECPPLQSIADNIANSLLESNALDFLAIVTTNKSQEFIEKRLDSECFTSVIEQGEGWVIGYSELHPYCGAEITLCGGSYRVKPGQKIAYELQQNQLTNPLILLTLSLFSISSGGWLAKRIFYTSGFYKLKAFTTLTKRRIAKILLWMIGLVIIAFLCLILSNFIQQLLLLLVLNELFFASIPEFMLSVATLLFIVSFVFTQNWFRLKTKPPKLDD